MACSMKSPWNSITEAKRSEVIQYDSNQKRIVTLENWNIPFMERYRRYVALVPEDTFTVVYEAD